MICPKCGHNMSSDSDFCMNCGKKVERIDTVALFNNKQVVSSKKVCTKCGKEITGETVFCPACGTKQNNSLIKLLVIIAVVCALIVATIVGIVLHKKSLQSPIEGVSQKVYSQGMEYLEAMESPSVRKATIAYVKDCKDDEMKDIYAHVEGVDFHINLGNKPTEEEIYFSELITKFWESWAICYGHESIIAEYEDSDDSGIQMLASMYKGVVSGFKDDISEAKDILKKADDYSDMRKSYEILEDIWKGED